MKKRFTKSLFALALGIGVTTLSTSAFAATASPVAMNAQDVANRVIAIATSSNGQQGQFVFQGQTSCFPGWNGKITFPNFGQAYLDQFDFPAEFQLPPFHQVKAPQQQNQIKKPVTGQNPVTNPGKGQTTTPSKNQNQSQNQVSASSYANQILNLVNQERAKAGLAALTLDSKLNSVATDKAIDMAKNQYFDHISPTYGSPFDMMKQYGVQFRTAGENIAMGQRSAQEVMSQWMNSQGHRENILNPNFTKLGVGFYNGYWVQEFIG